MVVLQGVWPVPCWRMIWHELRAETELPLGIEEVFDFFSNAENLERLTPGHLGFRILTPTPIPMGEGTLIDYRIRLHGMPMGWRTLISRWEPPFGFTDEQLRGPYRRWIHDHDFQSLGPDRTRMVDRVRYQLPLSPLGDLVYPLVRREVEGIFKYREKALHEALNSAGVSC